MVLAALLARAEFVVRFAESPSFFMTAKTKTLLRKELRAARRAHVDGQPNSVTALLFNHPPRPILKAIPDSAIIGLYRASRYEAPTAGYARFFHERGHPIALPRFANDAAPMGFARHTDPFDESDLVPGPFRLTQPAAQAAALVPDIVFAPLIGFTASGQRLGQGGGHYDRWLAEHPGRVAVGLAWDIQRIEPDAMLQAEPHDIALDAVVTPTRIYGDL
ncbi:MAG: 5-formyltetrahydrofolate cyclo-ligase [Pseudomonadota bacterium]